MFPNKELGELISSSYWRPCSCFGSHHWRSVILICRGTTIYRFRVDASIVATCFNVIIMPSSAQIRILRVGEAVNGSLRCEIVSKSMRLLRQARDIQNIKTPKSSVLDIHGCIFNNTLHNFFFTRRVAFTPARIATQYTCICDASGFLVTTPVQIIDDHSAISGHVQVASWKGGD